MLKTFLVAFADFESSIKYLKLRREQNQKRSNVKVIIIFSYMQQIKVLYLSREEFWLAISCSGLSVILASNIFPPKRITFDDSNYRLLQIRIFFFSLNDLACLISWYQVGFCYAPKTLFYAEEIKNKHVKSAEHFSCLVRTCVFHEYMWKTCS